MFLVYMVRYSGFILIALAVFGFVSLIIRARIRSAREKRAELETARQRTEIARARSAAAAAAAAEKKQAAAEKRDAKAARQLSAETARAERDAARQARQAERLETARLIAEYQERALAAARELKALETGSQPAPAAAPDPAADPDPGRPETISASAGPAAPDPVQLSAPAPARDNRPKPFAGQLVSFTGTLKSMKRQQAIDMVKAAGGKACKEMPAGTTILVVGDTKGRNTGKMDKAAEWIGQVKRITEEQFLEMFRPA